jgi:hypothetical protein
MGNVSGLLLVVNTDPLFKQRLTETSESCRLYVSEIEVEQKARLWSSLYTKSWHTGRHMMLDSLVPRPGCLAKSPICNALATRPER